jgi:hypothetical protein
MSEWRRERERHAVTFCFCVPPGVLKSVAAQKDRSDIGKIAAPAPKAAAPPAEALPPKGRHGGEGPPVREEGSLDL